MNAPFALPAEFIEREPEPIDLDPRPCGLCGRTIDEHECIDQGEGPELFCYPDDDILTRWELADARDAWHHTGEPPPPAHVRNSDISARPAKAPQYRTPQSTVDAFRLVVERESHTSGHGSAIVQKMRLTCFPFWSARTMLSRADVADLKREFAPRAAVPQRDDLRPPADNTPPCTEIPESADGERFFEPPIGISAAAVSANQQRQAATPPKIEITLPPLTLGEWRDRDLPEPDLIMGHWLSTTSRILLTAATGLGKTNYAIGLGIRCAAGRDFLHWCAHRPVRVLCIDGEMSRRLLKQRVLDEAARLGESPEAFFALSHEDIPNFKALNTPEGQAWLWAFIEKIGGVDLIIFDNIMCLTVGDQKDPEPWQKTIPLVHALTRASIGQIWVHHTGHDETRSYGDKSREWQMDTVAHLDAVKRDDTDVSFSMSFRKARERTPATRFDFQDVKIALVNDQWEHELTQTQRPDKISPQASRALDALRNVLAGDRAVSLTGGRRAAGREAWMAELALLGMIDLEQKAHSARTLFLRWRRELVAAFRIGCEGDWSWPI